MGFDTVYASLQQLFPQIDVRALRAVAIEHSKDLDAAVVAVCEEILPFFTERSRPTSPLSQNVSISESSEAKASVRTQALAQVQEVDRVGEKPSDPCYDTYDGDHEVKDNTAEFTLSVETHEDKVQIKANVHSHDESCVVINENRVVTHQVVDSACPQTEETDLADKCPEGCTNNSCDSDSQSTVDMLQDLDRGDSKSIDYDQKKEVVADGEAHDSVHTSGSITLLMEEPDMRGSNLDESELSLSTDTATSAKNISNTLGTEDESTLNATMSAQIHITDLIDEVIADARNNKKTLFLEMESVITLMKQVEVKEQAAEQAKTEAATGGMEILNQVEELKRTLQRAKDANNMHAGEVYGEKSILATELRELQSRVRSLSDERDVSLAILSEIRQSLEARLSAAVNEIKSAELRKLEKEELAQKSLAEQKLIMEEVVQESMVLRQQAEDNAKLEEFLLDRGRIVDTLQGEIGVICQDVKLLREKFDQHVPLGKSLFSSQTSFMLASLGSSLKSSVPETVAVGDGNTLENENDRGQEKVPEDDAVNEDGEVDGWEFFDSSEVNE